MNRVFKTREGLEVDLIKYSLDMMAKFPKKWDDLRVYIGTDSQNTKRDTQMVCVVAYRYPGNRGAHIIYTRDKVKMIRDVEQRLRAEINLSMEVATYLHTNGVRVDCIDFDFNRSDLERSHALVKEATGWALGMGFSASCKPDEQVSSRAADNLVRNGKSKRRRSHGYHKNIRNRALP